MRNPRPDHQWQAKILSAERRTDFAFTLARIHWDIFSTLTFQGSVPRPGICYGQAWRWCREVSEVCSVPYNRLLVALRGERGEQNGRFHFHVLVGGTTTRNTITLAHQLESLWKRGNRGARVECRPYDRAQAGPEYVAKCLGVSGANAYEVGKFSLADSVTLSSSVFRVIRGIEESGDRRCGLHKRINGPFGSRAGILSAPAGGVASPLGLNDEAATSILSSREEPSL